MAHAGEAMITMNQKKDRVLEGFIRSLKKYRMLRKGEGVLVAVSGGPDSISLFDLFYQIRVDWKVGIHIIHLNHGLRGDAGDRDQLFVERMARDLKMPVSSKKVDVEALAKQNKMSLEEAGRQARLDYFQAEANRLGIRKVALGHHKDDRAETVLFRILRGTGLQGIGAMRPLSHYRELTLIRPLVDVEKKSLEDYIRDRKLSYCIDASNNEVKFTRNRIRNRLLPALEKHYNPKIKNALAHLAESVALDVDYIEETVQKSYPKVIRKKRDTIILIKKKKFMSQPEALKFRILQQATRQLDPESELDYFHWDEIRKALDRDSRGFEIHVPHELAMTIERKELILRKPLADEDRQYEYKLPANGKLRIRELGLEIVSETFDRRIYKVDRQDKTCGIFDMDRIEFPVRIRNRREGDVFQPLGLSRDKKLKDFMIARKIPNYKKDQVPLFMSGDSIFWVYGIEISDRYKVTHRTRRFLKLSTKALK